MSDVAIPRGGEAVKFVWVTLWVTCTLSAAELTGVAGALRPYLDEPAGAALGAALRIPVSRRVAVRPEYLSSSSKGYTHRLGLGCVTVDLAGPEGRVVPYGSGCAGVARVRETPIDFVFTRRVLVGGAGLRWGGMSRWTGGAEFRAGDTAFPLLTFYAGFRFGK